MGAFSLFKRRRRSSEPAAAKTATPAAAEAPNTKSPVEKSAGAASGLLRKTSSKSKKASIVGASAGVDVPALPPRVELGILRTPSPPLVQVHVEGYRSDSPWVDLAAQTEPRRGSFGFGSYRTSSSSPTTRAVNEKLLEYLDGKLITPEQATRLVQECTKVLQGQGLETLGIFRPWRLAESPYIIAKTLALFLRAVCPDNEVPLDDRDLLGFSKDEDAFTTFAEALADAGTHNTVACLKWGLRHLQYGPQGFGNSDGQAWSFYISYVQSEISTTSGYDRRAFQNVILKELPEAHSELLIVCLELFANVAAHDAQNAMPGLHLCRLLAFWLFGRQHQQWSNWSDLYEDYLMAAACLEHLFLSYLRSQDRLPPRLVYLINPYPPERMHLTATDIPKSMHHFIELSTLHVILKSAAPAPSKKSIAHKRLPGALFASALQARHDDQPSEEFRVKWDSLVDSATDGNGESDGVDLILDETERIFAVVAERAERDKRVRINSDKCTSTYGNRRRSASIDVGMMHSTSSKSSDNSSNGRNRALSNDARMQTSPSQPFDISWGDFETKGFCDHFDSDGFSLFSEVGRPSMDEEVIVPRPQKLKKPYQYASLASRHMPFERRHHPERDESSDSPAIITIKDIKIVKIDPIFAEVYLESLEDAGITSKWPIFAVAELKAIGDPYKAAIVEVETSKPRVDTLPPSASTKSIPLMKSKSKTAPKPKRGLLSLGSRKKRMTVPEPESAEANDIQPQDEALVDEFRKRVAVKAKISHINALPSQKNELERKPSSKYAVKTETKPDPIAEVEEPIEERSTPSPSNSAGLPGRKLSRKAAPLAEDEDILLAEVVKEAEQAAPQPGIASAKEGIVLKDAIVTHTPPVEAKQVDLDAATTITETSEPKDSSTIVPIVIVSHIEDDGKSLGEASTSSAVDTTDEAASNGDKPEKAILHEDHIKEATPHQDDNDSHQSEPVHLVIAEHAGDPVPDACEENLMEESVAVDCPPATEPVKTKTVPELSADETSTMENASEVDDRQSVNEVDEPIAQPNEAKQDTEIPAEQRPVIGDTTEPSEEVVEENEKSEEMPKVAAVAKAEEGGIKPIPAEPESSSRGVLQDDAFQARPTEDEVTESTPRRFGSALNRVSPSPKERFVVPNKPQSSPEQDKLSEKSPKAQAPPSPSRRAALLSGAKKMLSRKKSTPRGLVADPSVADDAPPPLPRGDGPAINTVSGKDETESSKGVSQAAPNLEPSPLMNFKVPEAQQVTVTPATAVNDSTDTTHFEPTTSDTEDSENTSSPSRVDTSPISPVAIPSIHQAELTHQQDAVDEASMVQATGTAGTDMPQAQDLSDSQAVEMASNQSAEALALYRKHYVGEVAEDLQPEQHHLTKSDTGDRDTSVENEKAGGQRENTHGIEAALEHTIADTQYIEAQDVEEALDGKDAQAVKLVEPAAAGESSSVPSPLSSRILTAQDTVAATAGSIVTLAASVLPSSLGGLTDGGVANENKDAHNEDVVPPSADAPRESDSTTLKEQMPSEAVSQSPASNLLPNEQFTKSDKDNVLNSGYFPTQEVEVASEGQDDIAHSVIEPFGSSEVGSPTVSPNRVSSVSVSEDVEQVRRPCKARLPDDIKSNPTPVEDESTVKDTANPSPASAKDSQQDLKAHFNRQESLTKGVFSAIAKAPLAEAAIPIKDTWLGHDTEPSEKMTPPRNYALELDGQQNQAQPPVNTSEHTLGHIETAGQVESTANITNSTISGLPIHASQEVELPHEEQSQSKIDDAQSKFFENLAGEVVEDFGTAVKEQPVEYSGDHGALASIAESTEPLSLPKSVLNAPKYESLSTVGIPMESETTNHQEDVAPEAFAEAQEKTAYNAGETEHRTPYADSSLDVVNHSKVPRADAGERQAPSDIEDDVEHETLHR